MAAKHKPRGYKTSQFRTHLCTWNVAEVEPPKDLDPILGLDKPDLPDLVALGLQEVNAPKAYVFDDDWSIILTRYMGKKDYVRIKHRRLQGIVLIVYVQRCHLPFIGNVESEITKTGFGGYWGNKGGISIRADIYGVNLCVVNSHFQAHLHNYQARILDYESIIESHNFRDNDVVNILDHDYIFWMGDLNFRLDDVTGDEIKRRIAEDQSESLLQHDQLKKSMDKELLFLDYNEGPINFNPTYKFDPNTDVYDTSEKKRKPAWCDRILWMVHEDAFDGVLLQADQLLYSSLPQYKISDHKPVVAEFIIKVLSSPPLLPVQFSDPGTWIREIDNKCSYMMDGFRLKASSWDWVGLYKADFAHIMDYETYAWAIDDAEKKGQVGVRLHFSARYMSVSPGHYYLGYFSKEKNYLAGISEMFEIRDLADGMIPQENSDKKKTS